MSFLLGSTYPGNIKAIHLHRSGQDVVNCRMSTKRTITSLLFLVIAAHSFCQDNEKGDIRDITKVTIINPGLSYEKRMGRFQSLYGHVSLLTSFYFSYSTTFGTNAGIYFDPAINLQYRYYYNYLKREARDKRTAMNSLNYFCLYLQTALSKAAVSSSYFTEDNRRAMNTIAVCWGLQRNFPKRFSIDLSIGPGYLFANGHRLDVNGELISNTSGQFTLAGELSLGIWLNKRN